MTLWVYTAARKSESAKLLSESKDFRRMREGKLVGEGDIIVNWGVGDIDYFPEHLYDFPKLNRPGPVWNAINKRRSFNLFTANQVACVPWTQNPEIARAWQAAGETVVARMSLTGHEGEGILIIEPKDKLPEAPLYTKYIDKEKEWRVHATRFKPLLTHRKVSDPTRDQSSWKVRSYANGFIFQRKNNEANEVRDQLAVQAVAALGLDFGAVDLIEKQGQFYVLEVNTAPGIEEPEVPIYAAALKELAHAKNG